MGIIENIVFPIGIVVLIGGTVGGIFSCLNRELKQRDRHIAATLDTSQQYIGMKMVDFVEKFGAPYSTKEVEGIKFYVYYIDSVALLITTRDGVVTKVSKP